MSTPDPAAAPGALAALSVASGPRAGESLPVLQPEVTLGRAAGCDLVLDDDSVSARHARLQWDAGSWVVTDLGSVNGTAVDGIPVPPQSPVPLSYGVTLRLGGVRLRFEEMAGADPAAARATFVPAAEPVTLREERRGRLPLWLVLLVLVLVAAAAYLLVSGTVTLAAQTAAPPGMLALVLPPR